MWAGARPVFRLVPGLAVCSLPEQVGELGFGDLGDNAFRDAFERFLTLADRKKEITDEDVVALVDEAASRADDRLKVTAVRVTGHTAEGSSVESRRRLRW